MEFLPSDVEVIDHFLACFVVLFLLRKSHVSGQGTLVFCMKTMNH